MNKKSVYTAIIVFFVTFFVFSAIFSNWETIKTWLFGS
jgi:hypothetical protein